jgi:hypothetical protein
MGLNFLQAISNILNARLMTYQDVAPCEMFKKMEYISKHIIYLLVLLHL